jgi:predicted nucleic acid-binding protein
MSRLVVTDAGPLIHLEQATALSLFELTGEVLVPKIVLEELEDGPTDISELAFSVERTDIDTGCIYPHLDPGETAAIVVCTDSDAVVLTDDTDARNTASEEGIEVHGSVGSFVQE